MKVVVVCVQCFRSQAGLCWRVHGYSTQLHWQHSLEGTRHHAQLSMCTNRDKMAASGKEFSVLIECEFVAVVAWKGGWLWVFLHKICTRPIGRLVSQFYSWAVFTRLGRPDKWLVGTLNIHTFLFSKCFWKFHLQYGSHIVQASIFVFTFTLSWLLCNISLVLIALKPENCIINKLVHWYELCVLLLMALVP